ncbi:hypothetical protein [Geodermatophilus sabuli]|uniref:Uncharacterized protein n=1 Tax=Geodermatophilus sabuli TaxID=1564158 RepID=A0A285EEN9_9ACTN|nr:hypothetical protein [Geodermatophilus sabuli]MBB3084217.1 hypothetical protein [Geodermatophilus sabuli]SNX96511.1 hypothetical protein SAMN06893097_104226 [Geodermatophilus sabuli]
MNEEKHRPAPDGAAEAEILELLANLGDQRATDERRGGAAWAEFGDWCWAMDLPPDQDSVDLYAADRHPPLTVRQLQRLRDLAAGSGR